MQRTWLQLVYCLLGIRICIPLVHSYGVQYSHLASHKLDPTVTVAGSGIWHIYKRDHLQVEYGTIINIVWACFNKMLVV